MNKNLGLLWIVIVGGFGFAAGFFGPMIFAPGANQGPLMGIFITGPLGAIGGGILWFLSTNLKWSLDFQKRAAAGACALIALGIGVAVFMPEDEWLGQIYEIEVTSCAPGNAGEVILNAAVVKERIFKMKKPLLKTAFPIGFDITRPKPWMTSFYATGTCADFPAGFKAKYFADYKPAVRRDRTVLLPVPEKFKSL